MSQRDRFEQFIAGLSNEEVGQLVREYIGENNHMGWDGFLYQHLLGVDKLLEDLEIYYVATQMT